MARIRSLHPGQWTDEAFVQCSAFARLLALGLLVWAFWKQVQREREAKRALLARISAS